MALENRRGDPRWASVKAVFFDALNIPEAERHSFLADACGGDQYVEREVGSLLESYGNAGRFCEVPAADLLGLEAILEPAVPARLPPGSRLGDYEITGFIAAGGMGEVYRARDTQLGREVAIKRVGAGFGDARATLRLIREARHASSLKHPNICTIHEIGKADGAPFIVMELIDGRPLNEILREGTPPFGAALRYGIEIADALDHAHGRGIVHRDLKSSNIVIDRGGKAIVLDFGLARSLLKGTEPQSAESMTGNLHRPAGTLSHMSPEVLLGGPADERSDVWSMGVLLYELMTGELPFKGRTAFETSSAILGEPPTPMDRRVPFALRLVIERCLRKNPGERFRSRIGCARSPRSDRGAPDVVHHPALSDPARAQGAAGRGGHHPAHPRGAERLGVATTICGDTRQHACGVAARQRHRRRGPRRGVSTRRA